MEATPFPNLCQSSLSDHLFQKEVLGSMKNSEPQPDFEEYTYLLSMAGYFEG